MHEMAEAQRRLSGDSDAFSHEQLLPKEPRFSGVGVPADAQALAQAQQQPAPAGWAWATPWAVSPTPSSDAEGWSYFERLPRADAALSTSSSSANVGVGAPSAATPVRSRRHARLCQNRDGWRARELTPLERRAELALWRERHSPAAAASTWLVFSDMLAAAAMTARGAREEHTARRTTARTAVVEPCHAMRAKPSQAAAHL